MRKAIGTILIFATAMFGVAAFIALSYAEIVNLRYDLSVGGITVEGISAAYTGREVFFGIKNDDGEYTTNPSTLGMIAWILVGVGTALAAVANVGRAIKPRLKIVCLIAGICVLAGGIMLYVTPANFLSANPIETEAAVGNASATQMLTMISTLTCVGGAAGVVAGILG